MGSLVLILILFSFVEYSNQADNNCFELSCEECSDNKYGSCTKCIKGFTLIDGKCPCNDPNCLICTSSAICSCVTCKPGFTQVLYQCFKYPHCNVHGEVKCEVCEIGYEWDDAKKECVEQLEKDKCFDDNCKECFNTKKGSCYDCKEGYILKNGECAEYCTIEMNKCICNGVESDFNKCQGDCGIAKCKNLDFSDCENQCNSCQSGTLYEYIGCTRNRHCYDEHCEQCINSEEGNCHRCKLGYYLSAGKCYKINVENCLSADYSGDAEICSQCINNYDLKNGKCEFNEESFNNYPSLKRPEPANCASDDNCKNCITTNGTCTECNPGFDLNVNLIKGYKCADECKVTNCLDCSSRNYCSSCDEEYVLDNGICKPLSCDDYNCDYCFPKNVCIQCSNGWKVEKGKCIKKCELSNCIACFTQDLCLVCNEGYYNLYDQCVKCEDSNCASCTGPGLNKCTSCTFAYKNIGGECAKACGRVANCQYCSSRNTDRCIQCFDGYEVSDGECVQKKNNSFFLIVILCLVAIIFAIGVYMFCQRKKRREYMRELRMQEIAALQARGIRVNQSGNIMLAGNMADAQSNREIEGEMVSVRPHESLTPQQRIEKYEKEFNEALERCQEKVHGLCQVCNKQIAKYIADCGCKLCRTHAKSAKENENENEGEVQEDEEKSMKCPSCKKIIKKIKQFKSACGICMSEKKELASFKCDCAMVVCKNCYIKCRMMNPNCPACRAPLD